MIACSAWSHLWPVIGAFLLGVVVMAAAAAAGGPR